jgi:hypothetical protein
VAVANQLRAHLRNAYPGAVDLFADLDSPISLAFLGRFDTQDRADWLTPTRLARWLSSVGYSGRTDPAELHARLTAAPRGATGDHGAAHAHITHALTAVLTTLVAQIKALTGQIDQQLARHADAHIFTSLPRSGTVRAARLLAVIGDCRGRFPTPEALACLAGVAPSTRQSGRIRAVGFGWACDEQLRDAVTDFAGDSRRANPWAADLYRRARGHDHDTGLLIRPGPGPTPSRDRATDQRREARSQWTVVDTTSSGTIAVLPCCTGFRTGVPRAARARPRVNAAMSDPTASHSYRRSVI